VGPRRRGTRPELTKAGSRRARDVPDDLGFLAVALALVLDADPELPVGQVRLERTPAVIGRDGRVEFRFRQSRPHDREPEQGHLGRVRANADQPDGFFGID